MGLAHQNLLPRNHSNTREVALTGTQQVCVPVSAIKRNREPNAAIRKQLEERAQCISALIYKCCTIKGKCRGWFAGDKLKCRVKIDQHWACLWFHPLFASNGVFLMTLLTLFSLYTIGENGNWKQNNARVKRVEMIIWDECDGGWEGEVLPSPLLVDSTPSATKMKSIPFNVVAHWAYTAPKVFDFHISRPIVHV